MKSNFHFDIAIAGNITNNYFGSNISLPRNYDYESDMPLGEVKCTSEPNNVIIIS